MLQQQPAPDSTAHRPKASRPAAGARQPARDPGPPLAPTATAGADAKRLARTAALQVSLASSAAEREEAQRLRYLVFAGELGAKIGNQQRQVDEDEFDAACDHLIVRELASGQIVGTYRILPPGRRSCQGGLYADAEFDLAPLAHLLPSLVEVGRSCVHPDHRTGPSLMLLWSGLTQYMQRGRYEHLLGCASASLRDGGMQAATLRDRLQACLVAPSLRVLPRIPFAHASLPRAARLVMPPLIKGYLRVGARICGEPAWDERFDCADFLVWLPMRDMEPRYARHFKLDGPAGALAKA
jgi:putative hemolysin